MFSPDFATATGLLRHLNSDELKQLLNDEEKLVIMVKDLQQVKDVAAEKEMLIASNRSLAEYNLSLKPVLEQSKEELHTMYIQVSEMKSKVSEKKKQCDGVKFQKSPDVVLALLQTAAAEAEEETETCIEQLMNGQVQLDKFLEDYLPKRTHAHVLRTKSDKMSSLLRQNGQQQPTPPTKPTRAKKAPPPLPPAPRPSLTPIIPMRHAPLPPAPFPNSMMPSVPNITGGMTQQPFPRQTYPAPYIPQIAQPTFPNQYPYPQYVRMPLPN